MPAPIERGVMGAPQAHGISPLVAAAEKKQFKESSHYIPSDCLCEAFCPGREREQAGVFVSNQLEATREQTRDKTSVNSKSLPSHFVVAANEVGLSVVRRAQCSGIRGGMVTGLGTQRRLFSAQISPPTLYPGI